MTRRALLHIGLPKCGSSALQMRLGRNTDRLREHGVLYPRFNESGEKTLAHTKIMSQLVGLSEGRREAAPALASVLGEFADPHLHTLILSSEGMSRRIERLGPGAFDPLREFEVQFVQFVRRADAHALSTYKHHVRRERYTGSLTQFIDDAERGARMRPALAIGQTLEKARALLPEAKYHLVDLATTGGDSIAAFGAIVGLPLNEWSNEPAADARGRNAQLLATGRSVNQSHTDEKTLFLLECNRSSLNDAAIRRIDRAFTQVPDLPPQERKLLSRADAQRILDLFLLRNEAVESRFGIPLLRHEPMSGLLDGPARTALTEDERQTLLEGLDAVLDEGPAKRLREALKDVGGG